MSRAVSFRAARELAVAALRTAYALKFPNHELVALTSGRDLGDSWVVFLGLEENGVRDRHLGGAPVVVVTKAEGRIALRQIPPAFDLLDAPTVRDEPGDTGHEVDRPHSGEQE